MANTLRSVIFAGLAVAATGGGLWALQRQPTVGEMVIQTPTAAVTVAPAKSALAPTLVRIKVHVAGAVRQPGVYALSPDDRVLDAVEAAGGMTADADVDQVNLADRLQDAMRLYIPIKGEAAPAAPTPIPFAPGSISGSPATGQVGGPVNINTASQAELETLPHIGEAIAGRIIAYREANGPFNQIEDLQEVSGIGDKTYADLRDLIAVQ